MLALSSLSNAALVEKDLFAPGDHYLTLDTNTGLEWLDLTLTNGISYNDVAAGYGGYTTTYGFKIAAQANTVALFADAGLSPVSGTSSDPSKVAAGTSLIALVGCTTNCSASPTSRGFADLNNFAINSATVAAVVIQPGTSVTWDADGIGTLGKTQAIAVDGTWLYRAAVVPLPAASWLFGGGLLGLIGIVRRNKAA
jgi:hypothetical protein